MNITFREPTTEDITACLSVMKGSYPLDTERYWDDYLIKDFTDVLSKEYPSAFLLALLDDSVIGFGCYVYFINLNVYRLSWINILPVHQKKGIGKLLVAELEKLIMKENKKGFRIQLETDKPVFYKKLGYQIVSTNGINYIMKKPFRD